MVLIDPILTLVRVALRTLVQSQFIATFRVGSKQLSYFQTSCNKTIPLKKINKPVTTYILQETRASQNSYLKTKTKYKYWQ